jgi:alkylation response protein AidB-like acyl-CoA dehydrogenase
VSRSMAITELTRTPVDPVEELRDWLADNWDPDLSVAEWWARLGTAGWSNPLLPPGRYGRGLSRGDALRVSRTIAEHGALGAPQGLGLMLAAPTIATHGTTEQVERFVRDIVCGQRAWCQLFSEPGAGSDLAGLTTKAERDGDLWVVNGQKVWTSGGQIADMGMLIARTNSTVPKHQGITWFALDMHQPGVEVRPLREMTGNAMFNEVFLNDAVVGDECRIGDANDGWSVTNTTLLWERSSMGSGGGERWAGASPGSIAGDLDKRAGDFTRPARSAPKAAAVAATRRSPAGTYIALARSVGKDQDPVVRQGLAHAHILGELSRMNTERHKAVRAAGGDIPGIANFSKLLMAHILRHNRDLGAQLLGARATLHAYDADGRARLADVPGGNAAAVVTAQILGAQALPIYGGTDQIQRNIIGERALGLPKEPGDHSRVPFNELPRNG